MRATLTFLPVHHGDGYDYGGDDIVNVPRVTYVNDERVLDPIFLGLEFGRNNQDTANFVLEAINEKIEREFS